MNIEQLEALAFGEDRAAARESLVAGSVEHSYWTAIHLQHQRKLADVDALIARWPHKDSHGQSLRARLERRQLLLRAGVDFDSVVKELRRQSGVSLDAQRERDVEANSFPSVINAELDVHAEIVRLLAERRSDLSAFMPSANDLLVERWRALSPAQRQQLVARLSYSARPELGELVATELTEQRSSTFGGASVHQSLTLDQLLSLRGNPKVDESEAFVLAVLARSHPAPHEDWTAEPVLDRWITEALAFCRTLSPSFNRYRARALVARLMFDFDRGIADRSTLIELLTLPIAAPYANSERTHKFAHPQIVQGYALASELSMPRFQRTPDELVRSLCEHFVRLGQDSDLAPLLDRNWFDELRAKTLLCGGATDAEPFVQRFGPEWIAWLRDEVRLQITTQNRTKIRANDEVDVELSLKNVPALTIKVFEIDRAAYFHHTQSAAHATIDLDGMIAQHERTLRFEHAPIIEHRERIRIDECQKPGAYIIEFIGNGLSARAFIEKGQLTCVTRNSVAGTVLYAFDEDGAPVHGAQVTLSGRTYTAREDGGVSLPFSESGSAVQALVSCGPYAQVVPVALPAERFSLQLQARIERESLVAQKRAKILLRATMSVADTLAPLALLEEPTVQLDAARHDGVSSSKTERVTLDDQRESTVELRVAEDLASVSVTLRGTVRLASSGQVVSLSSTVQLAINGIHSTNETHDLYLSRSPAGYALDLLGKSGEPVPHQLVTLYLRHRAFADTRPISAQGDEHGRISLGPLRGFEQVSAVLPSGQTRQWLISDEPTLPGNVHTLEGETIELPVSEHAALFSAGLSLVSLAGGRARAQHTSACKIEGGCLSIQGLAPGAYELRTRASGPVTSIIVAPSNARIADAIALTDRSLVELAPAPPFVRDAIIDGDSLALRVSNATSATRVHVIATRFAPTPTLRSGWVSVRAPMRMARARREAVYLSNRQLGDEYRYVLERKRASKRAGVMLDKPSLLSNPWARESVDTERERLEAGADYQSVGMGAPVMQPSPKPAAPEPHRRGSFADDAARRTYDFVRDPAVIIENIAVTDGVARVPIAALGAARMARAITVDSNSAHEFEHALDERASAPRDLRLSHALAANAHAIEQRAVEAAPAGAALTVDDVRTSRLELLDTVASVWRTLGAINSGSTPSDWSWLPQWNTFDQPRKRALYNDNACHELHLFLLHKDRAFFDEVVRPHLATKRHKTFVDRALLGEDLARYLDPWALSKLNAIERALLARAMPAARKALVRWFADSVELAPPDPERERRLLDTILGASGLEGGGFADAADKLAALEQEAAAPAPPMEISADIPAFARTRMLEEEPSPEADESSIDDAEEESKSDLDDEKPLAKKKMAKERSRSEGGGGARGSRLDMLDRAKPAQLFRAPERTREWAESNWWRTREEHASAERVGPNRFWLDYAQHEGQGPFLSRYFAECATNLSDAACALAVMDVPFVAGAHATQLEDVRYTVTLASHALAAHTKIVAKELSSTESDPVLIGQRYLRDDDRDEYDGNVRRDKYVTGPMLVGVAYVCRVVVSNPTSSERELDLLLQIPRGAMPVSQGFFTRSTRLWLGPYATHSVEYAFYFPREGRCSHFGAHVSHRDALVACADGATLDVVRSLDRADTSSWNYLSQHAPLPQLLDYLASCNLQRVDLSRVAWRLRERDSFDKILAVLESRLHFDPTLWGYALRHKDRARARAWLAHQSDFLSLARPALDHALVELDPIDQGWYEHLEYAPLINARAHRVGAQTQILNAGLSTQYQRALDTLAHRAAVTDDDLLSIAHYLFAQERFDEARAALARVRAENITSKLAFDYLSAYAACSEGALDRARSLATPWRDYPVDRWRRRFVELLSAIDEAESGAPAQRSSQPDDTRDQRMDAVASKEPALDLAVESGRVVIQHRNVPECELRLYRMDIELLFSRQPFVQGDIQRFSWISPGHSQSIALSSDGRTTVDLPSAFAKDNLVIELRAKGARKLIAHYSHDLVTEITAAFGQLRVLRASTQRPLPATYVKVFARHNDGSVRFFKDGYTDLRGRFDYASVSTSELDTAQRFAILVCSDESGATVAEADVPRR